MSSTPDTRGRWALLIGINQYPDFGSAVELEGCVNDVEIMRDALINRFEFPKDKVAVLTDAQATRHAILSAMEGLVRNAAQGDEVVFYYSGHGSQQRDGPEKDEADGKDETFVPYDSGRHPQENRDISDDEIYLWLLRLTAATPFVTLIFDCCHSGTILRDGFGGKTRGAPEEHRPPSELAARIPPESFGLLAGGEDSLTSLQRLGDQYVAISACGSGETATEIIGEKGRSHGALTYHLVRALRDPGFTGATWREVFERVAPQVTADSGRQHPEVAGARDRMVFGVESILPMTYVPIVSRRGNQVVLGAGEACGLTVGSEWKIYVPTTRSEKEGSKSVGIVKISAVKATSSEAQIEQEEKENIMGPGARAVESARSLKAMSLAVEVVAPHGHPAALKLGEQLERSKFLRQVRAGEQAEARVYLLEPRQVAAPTDPAPMLGRLSEETWAPVGWDGQLLAPAFPLEDPTALESLTLNLENVARLRGVMKIDNTGSPLEKQIDFFIYRWENGRLIAPTEEVRGVPVFHEGDRLVLEIRNRSQLRLYVYLLDVGLTGKVLPIFPPDRGSHEALERGHAVFPGMRQGEDLVLFVSEAFHHLHKAAEGRPSEGLETLKLFVTKDTANFEVLFQADMRSPPRTTWTLNDILYTTVHGGTNFDRTTGEWAMIQRTFRVRSRKALPF